MKALTNIPTVKFLLLAAIFLGSLALVVHDYNWTWALIPFAVLAFYAGWLNRKLLFFFLIASLPFSFEYQVSSSLGTDIPDEALMLMVSFIFMAAWAFSPTLLARKKIQHPLIILLFVLLTWTALCTFLSQQPLVSFKFLLAKSWYLGAFLLAALILFSDQKNISRTAILLVISMFIVVVITLARQATLNFHFANINEALLPFFRNHVNYAAMLVCIIPVTILSFFIANKKYRPWFALITVLFIIALYFSYSRGAWLAFIIGGTATFLITRRKLLLAYIISVVLLIISLAWITSNDRYLRFAPDFKTTIFHKNFNEHWIATYKLKDVSTAERFYRWAAGIRMIKDQWLAGYGPNSFYYEYKPYTIPAYKTWVSNNPDHSTVHNYFLLTAIEQGIPGLLFLLILFGAMIWYAEKIYHRSGDKWKKSVSLTVGVIISMLLVLNFLSDLIETDKIGSIFFLCIAVLVSIDERRVFFNTESTE